MRDDRRRLDDVTSTVLARLGSHTHAGSVPTSRTISAGDGLAGGGDLTADRTLSLATGREARYYHSGAAQSIPNVTDRKVYLNSSDYTTADVTRTLGDTTTGSSFTINRAGLWVLSASVRFELGGTATAERYMAIANGDVSVRYTHSAITPGAGGPVTLNASATFRFAVNDVVAVWVYQASGGSLNLATAWNATALALSWLRP